MAEIIYLLSHIPIILAVAMLLLAAPLVIFTNILVKWRIAHPYKLMLAFILTYMAMGLCIYAIHYHAWQAYYYCYEQHNELRDMSMERNNACKHHLSIINGLGAIIFMFISWIPALGYVGFWEWIWRWRQMVRGKQEAIQYKHKWIGSILIAVFIIELLAVLLLQLITFTKLYAML